MPLVAIAERLFQAAVVVLVLLSVVFFGGRVIGDPIDAMLPAEATEASREALAEKLGLADPIIVQYQRFLGGALRGDFGTSFWQRRPALEIVLERLPATLYLTGIAMLVTIPLGIGLGAWGALRPGGATDRIINTLSLASASIVEFWLGLMLALFFAVNLGWFPTGGYGGLAYVILPASVLVFRATGRVAQFSRSALIDEYAKSYAKMARAKGLSEGRVFLHVLKNAGVGIITLIGDEVSVLVNGTVVVEAVFAWPGLGLLMIQAINQRDLPLLEASAAVAAVLIITVNVLVDLTYTALNPTIQVKDA